MIGATILFALAGTAGPVTKACSDVGDGMKCYDVKGDPGSSAGHESGGGYDLPTIEEDICDEDVPGCEDEDGEEVPFCRKKDEEIDQAMRMVGLALREACYGNGGPEYERGVLIYLDGTIGSFCVGNDYGLPDPNSVAFRICGEQDRDQRNIDVVAFAHCGESWSAEDQAVIDLHGQSLIARGRSFQAKNLRGYLVKRDRTIQEHQFQHDGECEKHVSE